MLRQCYKGCHEMLLFAAVYMAEAGEDGRVVVAGYVYSMVMVALHSGGRPSILRMQALILVSCLDC